MARGRARGRAALPRRDDLPAVKASLLRKSGAIDATTTKTVISFGDGDDAVKREIAVTLRRFPQGGNWSLFICPSCGVITRVVRLYDGRVVCRRCDGLYSHCETNNSGPRIASLIERIYGDHPTQHRPRLERSLRQALIVERRKRLKKFKG
jgi:uncharacterized Zn finger protein (UPF0148 family)